MKVKYVVILGAGASKAEGAPLQRELFESFFKEYKKDKKEFIKGIVEKTQSLLDPDLWKSKYNIRINQELYAYEEKKIDKEKLTEKIENSIIDPLKNYFCKFWCINVESNNVNFPTFEDCLGMLDLAYYMGKSFIGFNKEEIKKIRNALIFLIGYILHIELDEKERETNYHKKLVENLRDNDVLKETAFISLNYDLIIDNALMKYKAVDYGIDFKNKKRPKSGGIKLLKIHGSLNWLYCPKCHSVKITPKIKSAFRLLALNIALNFGLVCRSCNTPLETIIIPPTFYKDFSNKFIKKVFLEAYKVLTEAEKIFICGYSLPDADTHFRYLLKIVELYKGGTPKIYIFNKHTDEDEKKRYEQRYKSIFKDKKRVNYTGKSFECFVETLIKYL